MFNVHNYNLTLFTRNSNIPFKCFVLKQENSCFLIYTLTSSISGNFRLRYVCNLNDGHILINITECQLNYNHFSKYSKVIWFRKILFITIKKLKKLIRIYATGYVCPISIYLISNISFNAT